MKKMLLVMAATALVGANTVQAQSETVTSVNVVGYHSITIPANGIALVTPVLESFAAGTIADLVGNQLPDDSVAYLWNGSGYTTVTKLGRGGWSGAGATNIILRGDAVWLKPKTGTGAHTVTFMGEVPASYNLAATTTVFNIQGTDAVGYSYPIDILWTNTTLSQALPADSVIYIWNLENQSGYSTFTKLGRGGWSAGGAGDLIIKAGQAFWISTSGVVDWEEVVPYDL